MRRCSNCRRFRTRQLKRNSHIFRTRVDTVIHHMAKIPLYFDSQASTAAPLKIDISELRQAKAEGCPAFRSGRVYTAPLLAWFAEKRRRRAELAAAKTADESDLGVIDNWEKDAELPKSHWDRKKARLDYERALYKFEIEKERYLLRDEIMAAIGQVLAGFRTALNMLPSSAARWLIGLRDFDATKTDCRPRSTRFWGHRPRPVYRGHHAYSGGEVVFRSRRAVSRRVGPGLRSSVPGDRT